ncbi:hypothetical protein ACNO8S_16300 (plasmid) [Haloarcula sp. KBTZ06]|uniref:hypothetical protein n=1 Tax=Haloarcula sp. KBTZ06 TaxID=3402682 RepID=UPI003B43109C
MDSDDLPLSSEQLSIVGMALAVVVVSVAAPMLFAPQSNAPDNANSGTVYSTPTDSKSQAESASTPAEPASDPINELSTAPRNPDQPLSKVPDTHVESNTTKPSLSASAGAQTLRASTTTVDGEPALNLTDDRTHDGRWVGVSTDWLKDQHGSVPAVVGVVHESGAVYQEEVHVRDGEAQFWVSGFSTNTITFGGTLQIDGQPATTGTTHLYEVRDLDSATDPEITLTGQVNTERDTKQVIGVTDGQLIPLAVAGDNLEPRNPEVTFTGVEQTTTDAGLFSTTLSDGETVNYNIDGNQPATNVSTTFIGKSTSNRRTVSASNLGDRDTFSYDAGGNIDATDTQVTFTGDTSVTGASADGIGSGTVNVGGNIEPTNEGVSVTGRESTSSASASGSLSPGNSESLNLNGNLDPTNEQLTVTAGQSVSQGEDKYQYVIMDDTEKYQSEFSLEPTPSEPITSLKLPNDVAGDGSGKVDIYLVREGVDTTQKEGTLVASDVQFTTTNKEVDIDAWDPNGASEVTVEIVQTSLASRTITIGRNGAADGKFYTHFDGSPRDGTVTATYRTGADVTVEATDTGASKSFSVGGGNSETKSFDVNRADTISASGSGSFDYTLDYIAHTSTEDPSIDIDGDGTDEASWSGVYTSGESTTSKSVDGLSVGSNNIDATANGPDPAWDLSWTERTATENPSVDIDGDGTTDASYSGTLKPGETATVDASNIPRGSHTATVSFAGGQTDVDLSFTERTATKNPSIDINDDGTADASYDGVLMDGETVTRSLPDIESGSQTAQVSTGHKVGVEAGSTITTTTEDPTLDIDGDGMAEAEYLGKLTDGESQTVQIDQFDSSVSNATVGTQSGAVDVAIGYTERTVTEDAGVIINGQPVRMSGTLSQDDTTTLTANKSWLQSGQNNVTVVAGDGDTGTDAPAPTVDVDYQHELTTRRAVTFQDEAFSERYNISRTYLSSRESATLTIPHAQNIISLRSLEVRVGQSGSWTQIPASARSMQGTELQIDIAELTGGTVPKGTTVEVRSVGSKVDVHNGAVTVLDATPVGTDLDSRVRLDSWASDSYISVGNTSQAQQLHYGVNESYSAEGDYAELSTRHAQRVHFPEATAGSKVGVRAAPVQLAPVNGTIRASVPEQQTNATSPAFTVAPGQRSGESFTVEYMGATEGTWYGVYEVDTTKRFDRVQGREPMTVPKDNIDSVIRVKTASAPTANPEGASTIFGAADQGNLFGLVALFGSIAMLFVIGRRPERSRNVVDSLASGAGSAAGQLPRVGGIVEGGVTSGTEALGDAIVTLGENTILTSAVGAAALVAAIQSGYIDIGPELGAMLAVTGLAISSLVILQRIGEFTTARWIAIVGVLGVLALQWLGEGDLLTALVNSDAFVIVLVIAGYAVVQLVREYRANNSPDDDQPQVNIIARRSGGNGGSDD